MDDSEGGVYFHIPFCRNKCLYCDFYTGGLRIVDWNKYVDCLLRERDERINELNFKPSTLYIGGGTPSLMPLEELKRLTENFAVREFTIEVNPEDVDETKIRGWRNIGINRISVGVQSLSDTELQTIGRRHSAQEAVKAIQLLKSEFENISIDVMFGLPNQTLASYKATLQGVIDLEPAHISSYSLMLEPGTAMTHLVNNGRLKLPEEKEWIEMFQITTDFLKKNGFHHYEISNYALPGKESLHNTSYWKGKPYIGLGPGAHSYDGEVTRRSNPNDIKGYIKRFSDIEPKYNLSPFFETEILDSEVKRKEMVMTRLRMAEGINLEEFGVKFGNEQVELLLKKASRYVANGQMKKEKGFLTLTESGILTSDLIISDLF